MYTSLLPGVSPAVSRQKATILAFSRLVDWEGEVLQR